MENSSKQHQFSLAGESDQEFTDDEESSPFLVDGQERGRQSSDAETKIWDSFRKLPPPTGSLSEETVPWVDNAIIATKLLVYAITFFVVLGSATLSKSVVLLMTSQLKLGNDVAVCTNKYGFLKNDKQYVTEISPIEVVAWGWTLFFCFIIAEGQTFLRSMRLMLFKSITRPPITDFLVVTLFETLHVIGTVVLLYVVLPNLDVVRGAMLTNCFCFLPGVLGLFSRNTGQSKTLLKVYLDIGAISFQLLGFVAWPLLEYFRDPSNWQIWMIPVACFCISCGWWENFVDQNSNFGWIKSLADIKFRLWKTRYFVYIIMSVWKIAIFFVGMVLCLWFRLDDFSIIFDVDDAFSVHEINITEVRQATMTDETLHSDASSEATEFVTKSSKDTQIYALLLQSAMSYICYITAKYACKIKIQAFSFAFPLSLTVPLTITFMMTACGLKYENTCCFDGMPYYLFWQCQSGNIYSEFIKYEYAWVWIFWLLSQIWITLHIWTPKCERLVSTERLFVTPMYATFYIDQSIILNRRQDDDKNPSEFPDNDQEEQSKSGDSEEDYMDSVYYKDDPNKVRASDHTTRIHVCATMWHENQEEMMGFLKSIFRMDADQSARRITQQYFEVIDPDYYEFETAKLKEQRGAVLKSSISAHIYFDDAFEISDENENEHVVNSFVKLLVSIIEDAACAVHQVEVRLRPPKKFPTPYGGRLVWTLPGKTKVICHIKDKDKIRHKKRWSQVMYMYYLLGFKLLEQPISAQRKDIIAENTYLLALDGDIDFTPRSVTLVVDLMRKNKSLGAACGRIHPVGSGFMVWYQKFEYAVGHWMQKATEHVIGCVLCSPGCFAMFRGKALMDDNVMAKYTTKSSQARHYVQFDQGEDRWLCTLLLQRGYRVEYCAASDSYTNAPEGFGEFYNQRRRWGPSTMANVLDLLQDYKNTVRNNDSISLLYIAYQMMLMVGTVLGPGTIYLMISGSVASVFGWQGYVGFILNFIPLAVFMLVCFFMESKHQITLAYILTAIYAMVMMIVFIGMFINFSQEGYATPTAIFFIGTVIIFIITGLMHPQEINCLPHGIVYYMVIPSMYLLLQIYSLFNVNNVSWGTREVATKKTKEEQEADRKAEEEASKNQKKEGLLGFLMKNNQKEEEGSIEFSLAGLFKVMCCVQPKPDDRQRVARSLDDLRRKLEGIEITLGMRPEQGPGGALGRRRSTVANFRKSIRPNDPFATQLPNAMDFDDDYDEDSIKSSQREERDDLVNPFWMEDKDLKRGEVDFLPAGEVQFWKDLIEKYLQPLIKNAETQQKITNELNELRNISVFTFLMINSIFILVVVVLTLNQDDIHFNWPIGMKTNITYDIDEPEVMIGKEFLQLQPIGMIFVVFFGLVLLIQFFGMFIHRFGTLSHILATTPITICDRKPQDTTGDGELETNALAIVKNWQRLEGTKDGDKTQQVPVGRRATIVNIEAHRQHNNKSIPTTLDAVFKDRYERFTSIAVPNADNEVLIGGRRMTIRRDTIAAMVERRKSVVDRRKSVMFERRGTIHRSASIDEDEDM